MVAKREKDVGRFKVEIELANNGDLAAVRRGDLRPDEVRRMKILGEVNPGTWRLALPASVAKQLGIPAAGKVRVKYANGRIAERDRIEGVYLKLRGRHGLYSATLEPKRDTALIGRIVLNDLDLLFDSTKRRLHPRDAKYVVVEIG